MSSKLIVSHGRLYFDDPDPHAPVEQTLIQRITRPPGSRQEAYRARITAAHVVLERESFLQAFDILAATSLASDGDAPPLLGLDCVIRRAAVRGKIMMFVAPAPVGRLAAISQALRLTEDVE